MGDPVRDPARDPLRAAGRLQQEHPPGDPRRPRAPARAGERGDHREVRWWSLRRDHRRPERAPEPRRSGRRRRVPRRDPPGDPDGDAGGAPDPGPREADRPADRRPAGGVQQAAGRDQGADQQARLGAPLRTPRSPPPVTARDELRARLATDGILRASRDQPITHLNGASAPWAFYSWGVTLTGSGLVLAARALLDRLETFHATQLAAYGQTAQPLLGACIALGGDRYTGLSVRKVRKEAVTGRQIDGPLDRGRPVVIVDDSLVSGQSLRAAIGALEADGFEVEGAVCLVEFPHRGGTEWAWRNGYRVECLFDIWTDLGMADPPFWPPEGFPPGTTRSGRVPDGLSPAEVARWVARAYLRTGR